MVTLRLVRKGGASGERIELILSGDDLPPQVEDDPIYFEVDGSDVADVSVVDGFVGGLIHFLMETRQDLHIEGRISDTCLRNLVEYQRFWSLVQPERCSLIKISADEIVADRGSAPATPAVANYSGGTDSAFTVVRHRLQLCGMDTVPLQAVVIVHGFDVARADRAGFSRLLDRLQPVIEEYGLTRYVVRTNLKELALQNWLDSYASQIIACLHTVSHRHSTALLASDGYGQSPVFEYGGNPISVPLLTTSRLKVLYDGGHYGRTDKTRLIARYLTVVRSLKFCWEGPQVDRNCGRCLKCLLTYMNFRAVGVEEPACFDVPIPEESVGNFAIRHSAGLILGYEVLHHLWQKPELAELTERFAAPLMQFEAAHGVTALSGVVEMAKRQAANRNVDVRSVRRDLDLRAIKALNQGIVTHEANCIRMVADQRPWAYSAAVSLAGLTNAVGPARIVMRLQVERGRIGVLVLKAGSSEEMVGKEQSVGSSAEPRTVTLDVPAIEEAGSIVFRGWPNKRGSEARVLEVAIFSDRDLDAAAAVEDAGRKRKFRWLRF
jgi:hypothetical protein